MSRSSTILLAFCVAGGLAATTVSSRSAFVIGFFVVFWGSDLPPSSRTNLK